MSSSDLSEEIWNCDGCGRQSRGGIATVMAGLAAALQDGIAREYQCAACGVVVNSVLRCPRCEALLIADRDHTPADRWFSCTTCGAVIDATNRLIASL